MEWITFVKKENVRKAEEALKKDFDIAAKQSITIRDAKSIGINQDGSFFLIDGDDKGVEKCKELIKDFVFEAKQEDLKKARETIKKEEEAAAEGMGGIFNI
jgi:DNA-binding protein YbaB